MCPEAVPRKGSWAPRTSSAAALGTRRAATSSPSQTRPSRARPFLRKGGYSYYINGHEPRADARMLWARSQADSNRIIGLSCSSILARFRIRPPRAAARADIDTADANVVNALGSAAEAAIEIGESPIRPFRVRTGDASSRSFHPNLLLPALDAMRCDGHPSTHHSIDPFFPD